MTAQPCPTPKKIAHKSQGAARKHLELLGQAKELGPDWNVYPCPCGSWHIGHRRGSLASRIRKALRRSGR